MRFASVIFYLMFTFFMCSLSMAQETKSSKSPMFQLQLGGVKYSYSTGTMVSGELGGVSALNDNFAIGGFVGAYSSISSFSAVDSFGYTYEYKPIGVKVGGLFRITSDISRSHFYSDIRLSVGKLFQAGEATQRSLDQAYTYLGEIVIGYNFKMGYGSYIGFYAGAGLGQLNFDGLRRHKPLNCFSAGITFQSAYKSQK